MHETVMFTIWQETYQATDIPVKEAAKILQMVVGKRFTYHYFDVYSAEWRDAECYVGRGTQSIGTLSPNKEKLSSLSFNAELILPRV